MLLLLANFLSSFKSNHPRILLVLKDALRRRNTPCRIAPGGLDAFIHEVLRDLPVGLPGEEESVNQADDGGFLLDDLGLAVRAFFVAEESFVRHEEFAVGEALAVAPGDVGADVLAFLLGHAGQDGNDELAVGVHGVDILGLEENVHAFGLELMDGVQGIDGVAREAADTFDDNHIDLARKGVVDHAVEVVALFQAGAGKALIGVDLDELPVRVLVDQLGVVVDLGLIAGQLLGVAGGDPGVPGDAQ